LFSCDLLDRFASTYQIEIVTWAHPGERVHSTVVWAVVGQDRASVYVRSVRGQRGRWYRELLTNPEGEAVIAGERVSLRAVPVTSADEIERASTAFRQKYAREGPHLFAIVRPEVLAATLRLEPRSSIS